jgi:hypothetical protein
VGDPDATTLRTAALGMDGTETNLPDLPVTTDYQYAEKIPVFFGHYWLQGTPVISGDYAACMLGQQHVLGKLIDGGWTTPALALTLVGLVLSAAHTGKGDLLKGMDISYGLYIYQMPYIHFLKTFWWGGFAAFGATILTAALSWKFLEKPCVAFKRRAVA